MAVRRRWPMWSPFITVAATSPTEKRTRMSPGWAWSQTEQDNLVAFLQSLTDHRVRCSRAPFDHPELLVPDGQKPNVVKSDGRLADQLRTLAATGAGGDVSGSCLANAGDLLETDRNINGLPVKP